MRLFSKLMVAIFLLSIQFVNAQSCNTWITIIDESTGNVVQEIKNGTVYSSRGCVTGPEATIRIKIQEDCSNSPDGSGCQTTPHFTVTNFHGNYDFPVAGSEVYTNGFLTEFVTNILGGPITISGIQCNGLRVKAAINMCSGDGPGPVNPIDPCAFCPPGTENCLGYDIKKCCDMNCLILTVKDPKKCPGCYLVTVVFDDGTSTVINVSFNGNDRLMYCYSKKIAHVLSIVPYDCPNGCGDTGSGENKVGVKEIQKAPERKSEVQKDRIILSPNPTKTVVTFEGSKLNDYSIAVYDEAGKQVLTQTGINTSLSLEKLSNGIYIYMINGKDGYKQTGKIIKE
ncbi:T9SS type A sorting domain-containing protein [Flavobacterium wongokense]|uniref:T9SS type A sorting domain-containing protein n=1 Tax=Flavobacterium wongokense TaxID=2910674 RepID=UPI001F21B451|nr:T9SS type A sorting domain-containing protein [Flavobacterium sp. WG47]MCF6133090.1 T9SS type A sorting domain-containing protein [Flavobacterium sp. WG47]